MIDNTDQQLIAIIQHGLPLTSRPYADIGKQLNLTEEQVLERIALLKQTGLIKRLGVIVKHQRLGYKANAMVVMNVPDDLVKELGETISKASFVNLCYQRPRQGNQWPYNLYCMIHGKNRAIVLQQLDQLVQSCKLETYDRDVLFSRRCFKQRGAFYFNNNSNTSAQTKILAHG